MLWRQKWEWGWYQGTKWEQNRERALWPKKEAREYKLLHKFLRSYYDSKVFLSHSNESKPSHFRNYMYIKWQRCYMYQTGPGWYHLNREWHGCKGYSGPYSHSSHNKTGYWNEQVQSKVSRKDINLGLKNATCTIHSFTFIIYILHYSFKMDAISSRQIVSCVESLRSYYMISCANNTTSSQLDFCFRIFISDWELVYFEWTENWDEGKGAKKLIR